MGRKKHETDGEGGKVRAIFGMEGEMLEEPGWVGGEVAGALPALCHFPVVLL